MLRYMTAGESHGEALVAILDGMPAGLKIDPVFIDKDLARRMVGYGRGGRMKIENDKAHILSGIRRNVTTGAPISVLIKNRDFSIDRLPSVTKARPGHADLAGALKFCEKDIRNILERASARETASRVALGALAKTLLREFGIDILSHTLSIGKIYARTENLSFEKIRKLAEYSDLRCADKVRASLMKTEIDRARKSGDTLGGVSEIIIKGVPPGLGSLSQWDRRLDANLARCLMSIPAVKGVSLGGGFNLASMKGSEAHDVISYSRIKGFYRATNNAGGLEGGITNGEHIILGVAMKPISTLGRPLDSVDIKTKKKIKAQVERADVCAVASCGVVAEAVSALGIADAMFEKFGGDSLGEMKRNFKGYIEQIRRF